MITHYKTEFYVITKPKLSNTKLKLTCLKIARKLCIACEVKGRRFLDCNIRLCYNIAKRKQKAGVSRE